MNSAEMDLAQGLAKEAGEIIRKNFSLNMKKEWKADHTAVTETDLAINDLVLKSIKAKYPDHSILAEEGNDHDSSHEYVWMCDPVDGTHNFSHGIPTATFALALMRRAQPVLSVIHDPFEERLFTAEKGQGAFLNGERIHVSSAAGLKKTMIGLGKSKGVKNLFPAMEHLYDQGASMVTGLSIHYMTALVAAGELGASIFGGNTAHDMTPAKVLIEEAGGRVTDLYGATPERFDEPMNGQLASNTLIHEMILEALAKGEDLKKIP